MAKLKIDKKGDEILIVHCWVILFRVTEWNETKLNDFVSCFSNYYRDITILRNETILFRVLVISYRWTVLSYFVPTKTRRAIL
jgi:hypothetical protein